MTDPNKEYTPRYAYSHPARGRLMQWREPSMKPPEERRRRVAKQNVPVMSVDGKKVSVDLHDE